MPKKEEANDIVQYLLPQLENLELPRGNCKIDVTTEKSGKQRGDIWISLKKQNSKNFESNIVALIEAKHKNTTIGDTDWRDAMHHGKEKALKQKLNYYIATNCKSEVRFYNAYNDEEIILDGKILTKIVALEILQKIQSQVSPENSYVVHKASKATRPYSEIKFRTTLKKLADVYRSAGLKKGDDRIDPTISFIVLKHISDQEAENRTLNKVIKLWDDFRNIALDKERGDLKVEFEKMVDLIWGKKSEYKDNIYKDFKDLIDFPVKLKNEHFKKIYNELDIYPFHGAYFDLFGAIYEEFASQTKKKEFGEFYTRRHITNIVAKLLLRNEVNPRDLKICDPACGTGGFLTEAFKTLYNNYSRYKKLSKTAVHGLKMKTFWGFDNDEKSIARTKLNMFLVGDGHIHIYENDSLIDWNEEIGWKENEFDYIMTNPPMGQYDGAAKIEDFDFTNESRYELLFLEKVFLATKPGSEIAIVINDGALEAPTRENFRKKLLENCNVLAILSLTKFAFAPYTKEKTYILFMQKKAQDEDKEIQKTPIWHYILDYDGFANSDKRYRTKYHDDIPELEEKFDGAIKLLRSYSDNKNEFEQNRINFERKVNSREKDEALSGWKCKYVEMDKVNKENFFNLLSEFHLRPVETKKVSEKDFDNQIKESLKEVSTIEKDIRELDLLIKGG